jgi:cytochrome P450
MSNESTWRANEELKRLETDPSAGVSEAYNALLARCPVSKVHVAGSNLDYVGVFSHDDVLNVVKNFRAMSSTVGTDEQGFPTIVPLFADPPLHTGYRKLLNPNFPIEVVSRIRPEIMVFANQMVDEMVSLRDVEFYEAFATKFPTRVLCRFLGVPDEDWPIHYEFNMAIDVATGTGLNDVSKELPPEVIQKFLPYIQRIIADHRENPRDDVVNSLINGHVGDRKLEDHEIVHLIIALMLAGHATTTAALTNFVLRIASDQELQQLLRAEPHRIADALEECLRIDAPQQTMFRKCVVDTEIGGTLIEKGSFVLPHFGAANVDPARHAKADKFDIDREDKGHFSFGFGLHQCLGQHLARMDMQIAVETLLKKTSIITLNGPVTRRTYPVLAAIQLPLHLEPAKD